MQCTADHPNAAAIVAINPWEVTRCNEARGHAGAHRTSEGRLFPDGDPCGRAGRDWAGRLMHCHAAKGHAGRCIGSHAGPLRREVTR